MGNTASGGAIDLTPGKTLIKYTDPSQSKLFASSSGFTATGLGSADSDKLLERNEVYELKLSGLNSTGAGNDQLTTTLGTDTAFKLEVIPPKGAVLFIERITPIFLDETESLG